MNDLWRRLRVYLRSRSPRERWILTLAACVVAFLLVQAVVLGPLRGRVRALDREVTALDGQLTEAIRLAGEQQRLHAELQTVEASITPEEQTNLFTLLESLAAEAAVKDKLESIKPKQAAGNPRFPETRVEVTLRGAPLSQVVRLLHAVENAPAHLIIRSIRIKGQGAPEPLLDVSFSVSSFQRA